MPNYENFKFLPAAQKPYLEFPILSDGKIFDGSTSPGADRIVIGSIATDYQSAVFCAVLTHDGSSSNGFTECQDDSVNTGGKGSYTAPEGSERRDLEGRDGRELLDRIDL
ncbi:Guanyl-specific ribonuclease F1 protein [Rutstroemia sp. NJR-2017a BVV2]|nr:Guanyl-specific ribonuclease F1 protein [Rutstroemia sp. NJR-2017a BVV2]